MDSLSEEFPEILIAIAECIAAEGRSGVPVNLDARLNAWHEKDDALVAAVGVSLRPAMKRPDELEEVEEKNRAVHLETRKILFVRLKTTRV